jgi:hypothetical protein
MNVEESLRRHGLRPDESSLPAIRQMLNEEAQAEREGRGRDREEDLALLCAVQLFSAGQVDDALLIWRAKQSGFDLGCYLGVQLLCGPGLSETKAALSERDESDAAEALAYIQKCEQAGDFDGFSREGLLNEYTAYFGVEAK